MKKQIHSLLLLLALVAGVTAASTSSLKAQTSWDFKYSGSIVQWTAPQTGSYEITAYGAQGGGSPFGSYAGGMGAIMSGTFQLNQGDVLNILVGHAGQSGSPSWYVGGSGGGGSFVVGPNNNTNPLVVAGGGGGVSGNCTGASDATTSTTGNNATGTAKSNQEGSGGTGGGGGSIGSSSSEYGGGGGGGFSGDGGTHYLNRVIGNGNMAAQGGFSYLNGGFGGDGSNDYAAVTGGFGGGGVGQSSYYGSGGGGGYSGGGGGGGNINAAKGQTISGGGGGSYLAPSATDTSMSVGNTGNGLVTIDLVSTAATPSLTFRQPSYSLAYSPNAQLPLKAYSESPGAITFASDNPSVIAINGNTASTKGAGQATITATVAAAPRFRSTSASITVTINKTTPYLGLVCPSTCSNNLKQIGLGVTTSSDGAVTYTSSNPSVISIVGNKAKVLKKGVATITASVAATANYFGATATRTVTVK